MCLFYSIDAFSSSAKARFANDGINEAENITIRKIVLEKPHLCLFAKRHIHVGDELRYDYGYTDAEWRQVGTVGAMHVKMLKLCLIYTEELGTRNI